MAAKIIYPNMKPFLTYQSDSETVPTQPPVFIFYVAGFKCFIKQQNTPVNH